MKCQKVTEQRTAGMGIDEKKRNDTNKLPDRKAVASQ